MLKVGEGRHRDPILCEGRQERGVHQEGVVHIGSSGQVADFIFQLASPMHVSFSLPKNVCAVTKIVSSDDQKASDNGGGFAERQHMRHERRN